MCSEFYKVKCAIAFSNQLVKNIAMYSYDYQIASFARHNRNKLIRNRTFTSLLWAKHYNFILGFWTAQFSSQFNFVLISSGLINQDSTLACYKSSFQIQIDLPGLVTPPDLELSKTQWLKRLERTSLPVIFSILENRTEKHTHRKHLRKSQNSDAAPWPLPSIIEILNTNIFEPQKCLQLNFN